MSALFWLIDAVLEIYIFLLIVWVIMSWLVAFNVINTYNRFVSVIMDFLYRITEPVLRPIRSVVPDLGGIDLSPLILLLLIQALRIFLHDTVGPAMGVYNI